MRAQKLCFFLLGITIGYFPRAQVSQQTKLLPMLAPSSPEVASLGRYGSYEVNLCTGLPDISIPIYDIQVGELKLPVRISYHPSGIKVTETASRIGLGWSLDAGGTITRKIQCKPDEQTNNYFAATSSSVFRVKGTNEIDGYSEDALDYLSRVDVREYDGEPDIFSYNFPGHSGRFLFNQKDSFKTFLIPFEPVAVSKTYVDALTVNFSIKDEGGRIYAFNDVERTTSGSGVGLLSNTASDWLLSNIISANAQDSIRLKYSSVMTTDQYENEYFIINDNATTTGNGNNHYSNDLGTFSGEIVGLTTYAQRLDSILFLNGKVIFEEAPESRNDFNGVYSILKRLKFIKIFNYDPVSKTYGLIKVIQLFHSYFIDGSDNSTKRLRLDSIQFQTPTNIVIQTYRFDYNTTVTLPGKLAKKKDFWGYLNNRSNTIPNTSTPTSIPKMKHTYAAPPGAPYDIWIGGTDTLARYPDPNYMQAYILQKITFPTGGYTQFEYETNRYLDENGISKYAGGLRIKSIKSYTGSGATPIVKTYRYGQNESGYGRANFFLEQCFFANHQNFRWVDGDHDPGGNCMGNSYKTMHTYFANPTNDIEGSDGSPVFYSSVSVYEGDSATNIGKTVYQFTDKADAKTSIIGYGKPFFDSYQFIRGLQTGKAVYKTSGSSLYTLVTEEHKKYQFYPYQWTTQGIGLIVRKLTIDEGFNGVYNNIGTNFTGMCYSPWSDAYNYNYNNYNIVSGDNRLVTDTVITYDQKDPTKSVSIGTSYIYDDSTHLGLSQVLTTNSKNELVKTVYTYPYNSGSTPYNSMNAVHIWDKVVTETRYNGATQIAKQTNNYSSYAGSNYLLSNIVTQIKSNAAETRASFNSYDTRGNILEAQKANDFKVSYVWDTSNNQPTAEVTGASQSDIAYTSFELNDAGGWAGVGSFSFSTNGSVTGKRAYNQNSFSFSKSGLSNTRTYIVSYWSKSGSYLVNSSSGASMRSLNGWTLYQHSIVNPSGGTISITGSGIIDELRLYPAGALMKSNTYEPLVGLSSACDANSHFLYYFYDGACRLMFIKDEDGFVLKKNCYNYTDQTGDCSVYGNTTQNGNYTKNNCTGGLVGSQITYTVPANTYYAVSQTESNTLAQRDVTANGQAYANAYGTCSTPPITITGSNSKSISYTVKFTKSSNTSIWYSFSLPSGASNSTLGTIPPDTYNVQFQPNGNPPLANFNITTYTLTNATGATFNNVSLTSNALARVY